MLPEATVHQLTDPPVTQGLFRMSLAKARVDLIVNLKPTMTRENYELVDDMVLRNSGRTCVVGTAVLINSPSPCP